MPPPGGTAALRVWKVGIVGLGKIALDQHVPVIVANPAFQLAGIASRRGAAVDGVPTFATPEEMLAAIPDLDAVAVCTPPQVRHGVARAMLAAGKHVLLEKPPAATLSEFQDLTDFAAECGRVLFATWHSQYNEAVAEAERRLAGKQVAFLSVNWREDVRRWHPGQSWLWAAGGFGVFDPGINALSIVTRIMPTPIFVRSAELTFPRNCDAPIAATLDLAAGVPGERLSAVFDWRQTGDDFWEITVETGDGDTLRLQHGGAILAVNGTEIARGNRDEYPLIYQRFAELLHDGVSDVDGSPLRLVADAFLIGRRIVGEPFIE
jgi:D-galactose 1-dehydrogenase